MTTHDPFWQLSDPKQSNMATDGPDLLYFKQPSIFRSSSDSVVISNGKPAINAQGSQDGRDSTDNKSIQDEDIAIQTTAQGTLVVAARASALSQSPSRSKSRHQLQLPSFQALGIAVPYPASILTPPDEPVVMDWQSAERDKSEGTPTVLEPASIHISPTNTPRSPLPNNAILGASNDTPTQGPVGSLISPSIPAAQDAGSNSSNSSAATEIALNAPWLEGALTVIRE